MIYAQTPARRSRQIAGDVAVLVWVLAWAWVGTIVHGVVVAVAAPMRHLQQTGTDFSAAMTDAGQSAVRIPFAGGELQSGLDRAARFGQDAARFGLDIETLIGQIALALGLVVALAPILGLGIPWLVLRWQFARRAEAAQRYVDSEADLDLFALRAMANQPLPALSAISEDPVSAWRAGDREVIAKLAASEFRRVGLHPPRFDG
ncbi:MAG: hypothetical protein Q4G43_06435 [Mobilicoccus sp.]|nr:hypothetical protein [Mobilicoccus sp.]